MHTVITWVLLLGLLWAGLVIISLIDRPLRVSRGDAMVLVLLTTSLSFMVLYIAGWIG